eukprot:COSAG01_NODE_3982_length_5467_cov_3.487891_11_plen_122_part_00
MIRTEYEMDRDAGEYQSLLRFLSCNMKRTQDAKAAKAAALKIRQLETKVSKLQDNLAKEQAKVAAGAGSAGATKDMERQHKREMTALEKKLAAAEASVAASAKAAEKSALRELHDQNRSSD